LEAGRKPSKDQLNEIGRREALGVLGDDRAHVQGLLGAAGSVHRDQGCCSQQAALHESLPVWPWGARATNLRSRVNGTTTVQGLNTGLCLPTSHLQPGKR
jgi:hypothetical protein